MPIEDPSLRITFCHHSASLVMPIEDPSLRITFCHHSASLVMPIEDPSLRITFCHHSASLVMPIEDPSLRITFCHHSASLVMPMGDPRDGYFYLTPTLMMIVKILSDCVIDQNARSLRWAQRQLLIPCLLRFPLYVVFFA